MLKNIDVKMYFFINVIFYFVDSYNSKQSENQFRLREICEMIHYNNRDEDVNPLANANSEGIFGVSN